MGKRYVVGYCRVSTEGQTGEDKYGIDAQKRDIRDYCEKNGLCISRWYIEEAVSGSADDRDRPELTKILNGEIMNPPIQAVIVAKNDRLARSIENFYGFKYMLKRNNIDLISVAEDFGDVGLYKPIYEAISAAFAELERSFITMRMSGGRMVKASQGGYAGGKPPFGYRSNPITRQYEVDPREADTVRMIFRLRDEGHTMKEICQILEDQGRTNRKGNSFHISGIQSVLGNQKTYQGFYKYGANSEWVKGIHEAILPGGDENCQDDEPGDGEFPKKD